MILNYVEKKKKKKIIKKIFFFLKRKQTNLALLALKSINKARFKKSKSCNVDKIVIKALFRVDNEPLEGLSFFKKFWEVPMYRHQFRYKKSQSSKLYKKKLIFIVNKSRWKQHFYTIFIKKFLTKSFPLIDNSRKYSTIFSKLQQINFLWRKRFKDLKAKRFNPVYRLTLNLKKAYKVKKPLILKYLKNRLLLINNQNQVIFNKKKHKIIYNYMFLNNHSVKSFYVDFYLNTKYTNLKKKQRKDKKRRTFFFNFWKKKLKTFKKARQVHWYAYTKKTLKKRRYRNFLKHFLKKKLQQKELIFNNLVFRFKLSYVFWKNFAEMYKTYFNFNLKKKTIYQLPINYRFWVFLKKIQNNKLKIKKKINTWLKTKRLIKRRFWMQRKRQIPPFFSKQIYFNNGVYNNIHFDFVTNYFCILKNVQNTSLLNKAIYSNKLLKLHNFRYKA